MQQKGQGAIEYLLIIAAAVLVVAIMIIAITGALWGGQGQIGSSQQAVFDATFPLKVKNGLGTSQASLNTLNIVEFGNYALLSDHIDGNIYVNTNSVAKTQEELEQAYLSGALLIEINGKDAKSIGYNYTQNLPNQPKQIRLIYTASYDVNITFEKEEKDLIKSVTITYIDYGKQPNSGETNPQEEDTPPLELAPIKKKCYNQINTTTKKKELICLEEFGYPLCNTDVECGTGFECFDGHCFEQKENTVINSLECLEEDIIGANCGGGKLFTESKITTPLFETDQWTDAETTCKNLDYDYTDWRLPTKEELTEAYTIIGDHAHLWVNTAQDACTPKTPQRCGLGYELGEKLQFICVRESNYRAPLEQEQPQQINIFEFPEPPEGITIIYTCQDLQNIKNNPNENYLLDFDINCTEFTFEPIQTFNGTLDGDNWEITNLKIESNEDAAIFKELTTQATIKNLVLKDIEVTSTKNAAGLAILAQGKIEKVKMTGTIDGKMTGGLTTINNGHINQSQAIARVKSSIEMAGIITSENQGLITDTQYQKQENSGTVQFAPVPPATTCTNTQMPIQGCTQITKDPECEVTLGETSDHPEISVMIYGEIPELSDKGNKLYNETRGQSISSEFSSLNAKVSIYTSGQDVFPITYQLRDNEANKYIKSGTVTGCVIIDTEHYECDFQIYAAKDVSWNIDIRRNKSWLNVYKLHHSSRILQLEISYTDSKGEEVCSAKDLFLSEHTGRTFGGTQPSTTPVYPLLKINLKSSGEIPHTAISEMMRDYKTYFKSDPGAKNTLFAFNMTYYSRHMDPYYTQYYILFRNYIDPLYRRVMISEYLPEDKIVNVNGQDVDYSHILLGLDAKNGLIADGQIWYDGSTDLIIFQMMGPALLRIDTYKYAERIILTAKRTWTSSCPSNSFWQKTVRVAKATPNFQFVTIDAWAKRSNDNTNTPDILGDWYGALLNRKFSSSSSSSLPDFLDATIPTLPNLESSAEKMDNCYDYYWSIFTSTP